MILVRTPLACGVWVGEMKLRPGLSVHAAGFNSVDVHELRSTIAGHRLENLTESFRSVMVKRHAVPLSAPPFTVSTSQCPNSLRVPASLGRFSMLRSAHFARLQRLARSFSAYFTPLFGKSVRSTPATYPRFTQLQSVFSQNLVSVFQPFKLNSAITA